MGKRNESHFEIGYTHWFKIPFLNIHVGKFELSNNSSFNWLTVFYINTVFSFGCLILDYSFWAILGIVAAIPLSVIIHELGHYIGTRIVNVKTIYVQISLTFFTFFHTISDNKNLVGFIKHDQSKIFQCTGCVSMDNDSISQLAPVKQFIIFALGPLFNLLILLLSLTLLFIISNDSIQLITWGAIISNAFVLFFSLIGSDGIILKKLLCKEDIVWE
jgi:hypothetical protein